jgi:hypothetical protein
VSEEQRQRRDEFVKELAKFLIDNQVGKSIALQMPPSRIIPWAKEWATLRQKSFVHGYPTLAEGEAALRNLLGI